MHNLQIWWGLLDYTWNILFHTLKQNRKEKKSFLRILDMKLIIQHPLFGLADLMLSSYPVPNTSVPGKSLQSLMESNGNCIGLI